MAERLLHHHPRGIGYPSYRKPLDHHREQKRRDLEIETGVVVPSIARLTRPYIGRVGEIAVHA